MAYYFYANYPTKKITVHCGDCGHCKEGKGVQALIHGEQNGFWSQAYQLYNDARENALSIGSQNKLVTADCGRCRPGHS